jgi:hypothetical protein
MNVPRSAAIPHLADERAPGSARMGHYVPEPLMDKNTRESI